jgi:PPOX class probable FMN-dependent enzyme
VANSTLNDVSTNTYPFSSVVTSEEQLREVLGEPSELIVRKIQNRLDSYARLFISRSPLLAIASSGADGSCDVSPRGDPPGFVRVLDDRTLLIPDRPGNRRGDALRNLLSNPHLALLFMIPRVEITLRVNGRAAIVRDTDLLAQMEVGGKIPALAMGVFVDEVYFHCAKPFKRSHLWNAEGWPDQGDIPSLGEILFNQSQLEGASVEGLDRAIEQSYKTRLY